MYGINPKWVFILGILVTIEQAIAQGAVKLTNMIPADWIPSVVSWSAFLALVGTTVMTAMSGYSSRQAGPLNSASAFSPAVKAAAVIAILLTGLLFSGMPASAATVVQVPSDPLAKIVQQLETVKKDIVDGVLADITAADQAAVAGGDDVAHACYPAQIKFLQSLPTATALSGKYVGVQVFQLKRNFIIQLRTGLPSYLKVACAALIGDELSIFVKTMGLVGVSISAPALLPMLPAIAAPLLPVLAPVVP